LGLRLKGPHTGTFRGVWESIEEFETVNFGITFDCAHHTQRTTPPPAVRLIADRRPHGLAKDHALQTKARHHASR
jgi:hypothetical protein